MERRFQIHLITDRRRSSHPLGDAVVGALEGGIDAVQLREKGGPALLLYETALAISPAVRAADALLLINDRVDVALATGADGVHLAAKSLPPEAARRVVGGRLLLGVSVHGVEEAKRAEVAADYLTFGHVYPTSSKPGLPPRGVRELARVVEAVEVPVLAIGGIDASNAREVAATGASGIAVISAILAAEDPRSTAEKIRETLETSPHAPRHPFPKPERKGAR
ncbi:MAG: thiamine phosphate synthase [Rubrobacteraceae bacterium]|nr:thiamine phosphate synthase [Rubrobacteraceae bacterium]MCL6438286.1 thiamine phosphate synthase [Rubrobacteraceae bacterium]